MPTAATRLVAATQRLEQSPSLDRLRSVYEALASPLDRWSGSELLRSGVFGHALHPLLTDLPLGLWTAATALDLRGRPEDRGASRWLVGAGLAAAGPTALTGLAEWAPAGTEAQRVGALHGALNAAASGLYLTSYVARSRRRHTLGVVTALRGCGADRRLRVPRWSPHHRPQGGQPQPGLRRRRGGPPGRRCGPSGRPAGPARRPGRPHVIDVVERDGLAIDVRDEGPRGGEVVVLLHGFPQDSRCWAEVVPTLHRAGLRTLAPDQRGYSPGASPADVSQYRVSTLARDVVAVLDAAGARTAHVVGHDWGGAVAWYLGAHHPDRVDSLTVLSTPHPGALAHAMTRSLQPLRSWYTLAVQVPVLPELVLSRVLGPALRASGLPGHRAEQYGRRFASRSALHGPLAWYRAAGRRPPWEVLDGVGAGAGSVAVPTTYVWGRHDPVLGRTAAEATADHVTGDYLFVELDAGHWLPELNPDDVAGAVLDRVDHTA